MSRVQGSGPLPRVDRGPEGTVRVLVFLQSLKPLLGLRVELRLEGPSGTDPTPASSISGPCLEKPGPTDPSAASSSPAPGLLSSPKLPAVAPLDCSDLAGDLI
ncbi:unnamed protein product [Rangifer tarandus platyrhynchus]|uniref:Uncharacterized protein n=1 Tax=Rangifer tarandus platyrhynchus TaxID=3082113 RepID=A0ABN8ZIN8_RANTA|nr:unnamed protein product [Rangifer tarandus platyrhynchus]